MRETREILNFDYATLYPGIISLNYDDLFDYTRDLKLSHTYLRGFWGYEKRRNRDIEMHAIDVYDINQVVETEIS